MTKLTARSLNHLEKVILFTLVFFFVWSPSFSQVTQADTVTISKRIKITPASFNSLFLSSFKDSTGKVLGNLMNSSVNKLTAVTNGLFKKPLILHEADVSILGSVDSSWFYEKTRSYRSNFDFTSSWSVADIPLGISFQQQSWSDFSSNNFTRFSFRFDRENFLQQLKKKLAGKLDPSALMDRIKNPLENVIAKARQTLVTELEGISRSYKGLLGNEVQQIKGLQSLFTTDIKSLKEKFLNPSFVEKISAKQNLLSVLQQQVNNGERVDAGELNALRDEVLKMKGLQDLITKIEQHKAKWEQSGLLKKIKEFDVFKRVSISKLLDDPSVITRLARQKLSLSGLQRFFLNVNRLNIGQNTLSLSPLSFQHFLSKGVSFETLSNKRSLLIITGKQTDFNSILDYPFSNSPFSNNGIVRAFGMASGNGTRSTTNLSVSSFSQSLAGFTDRPGPDVLRQVLVTTISNTLLVGEKGMISAELSRSATQYTGLRSPSDSFLVEKNNFDRIFSAQNFMANTAISVKYADEFTDQGLSYHISFNKTANGYANPGNSYLSAGSTELGAGIRKTLLIGKLFLSFRGNSRVYKYNDKATGNWTSTYMLLDAKWKMKKGQYISLRYQPVRMVRKEEGTGTPVSSMERIAINASVYKKIGKFTYRNFISLSGQRNIYSLGQNISAGNSSVMISSFQHFLIDKTMLYANLNYNHSGNPGQYIFLGSSLYTEAGYSYQLFKNIIASSGLVYNSVKGWYTQVGIRQTVSGQLGEKFNVNIYVDLKKNLKQDQPFPDDPVRADISLRYLLKNKN